MLVYASLPESLIDTALDLLQAATTTEAQFVESVVDAFKQIHGGFSAESDRVVSASYND